MKPIPFSWALGAGIILASCSVLPIEFDLTSQPRWIEKWLTSPACTAPCWEHITPGETTVEAALVSLASVDQLVMVDHDKSGAHWTMGAADQGRIIAVNGLVHSIEFSIASQGSLVLEDLLHVYGPPAAVDLYDCQGESCVVGLRFPARSMVAALVLPNAGHGASTVVIRASSPIQGITLLAKLSDYVPDFALGYAQKLVWTGYGTYP